MARDELANRCPAEVQGSKELGSKGVAGDGLTNQSWSAKKGLERHGEDMRLYGRRTTWRVIALRKKISKNPRKAGKV